MSKKRLLLSTLLLSTPLSV